MISKYKHSHKMKHSRSGANVRAPKGFYFKIEDYGNDNFYIRLYKRGAKIGSGPVGQVHLTNVWNKKKWLATHSSLNAEYRNKGIGSRIYARAIQFALDNGYRVKSSGGSSDMAQRVWRGHYIRKWFRIKTTKNFAGAVCPNVWYAYSK